MSTLLWLTMWLGGLILLAYHGASLFNAAIVIGLGLILTTFFSDLSWFSLLLLWGVYAGTTFVLLHPEYRRKLLIYPTYNWMSQSLPTLSETEKTALEAGTVGWEAELFSGHPQWEKLLTIPVPKLSEEEQHFIQGPVKQLCEMVNDWEVTHQEYDLPQPVWDFLTTQGFFGLVIPKKFGGKGFSEFAHSEIIAILASRSLTLSSTVAVPNSLGPAELLLRYGTQAQRDYYLPRLASGKEIPCFALTSPQAGSDASNITDTGIVCRDFFEGKEIIGIRLNWDKRYITLAPIATLLGLAFKLYDPEGLLGEKKELGITCALISTQMKGITIGRRHLASSIPFQNGPTQGKNVFIPVDWIIGGQEMAGQGWRMLIECLSTGRAISLPSSSVGGAKIAVLTSSAYALIRRQFRTPLSQFEGIQEVLGRIGGLTYLSTAVQYLTISMINAGQKPTVPGAIAKYHVTEMGRQIANDAMDLHGGKGIMIGPSNYLIRTYQGVPIGITVEGANILTRNMIIFGQGAIRCHPYLLKEMQALQYKNLTDFEHYFGEHLRFTLSCAARAFFHGLTLSRFATSPVSHEMKPYFQQLSRASSAFALVADTTMALLGGKLKFKEALSAKLGDCLSMMYLASALLKRYQDQNTPKADLPLMRWSLDYCFSSFWQTLDTLLRNLPKRSIAFALKIMVMPFGIPCHPPQDRLNKEITQILTTDSEARNRLLTSLFLSENPKDSVATIELAFKETLRQSQLLEKIYTAIKNQDIAGGAMHRIIELALNAKIINEQEAADLSALDRLCQKVIHVDDFSPEELPFPLKKTEIAKEPATETRPLSAPYPGALDNTHYDPDRLN